MAIAAILFVVTALGGAGITAMRLRGIPRPPTWIALAHGALALTSLAVLGYTVTTQPVPTLGWVAFAVLGLAALGGVTIFVLFHQRKKALPIPLVIGHGLIALTGMGLLLAGLMA